MRAKVIDCHRKPIGEPERKCVNLEDAANRIDELSTREGVWTLLIGEGRDVSGVKAYWCMDGTWVGRETKTKKSRVRHCCHSGMWECTVCDSRTEECTRDMWLWLHKVLTLQWCSDLYVSALSQFTKYGSEKWVMSDGRTNPALCCDTLLPGNPSNLSQQVKMTCDSIW